jgi:hypothetical protein
MARLVIAFLMVVTGAATASTAVPCGAELDMPY